MITSQEVQQQSEQRPKYTGKRLVMLDSKASYKTITSHSKTASLKLASFTDYTEGVRDYYKAFDEADGIVFEQFGVAVVNENKERQVSLLTESSASKSTFIYSEPERYVYALVDSFEEFMRGYKSAVDDIFNRVVSGGKSGITEASATLRDDAVSSWGIKATKVLSSPYSGKGIKVAILDTGFHLKHPDFEGRAVVSKSFIRGQKVEDQNGHGSHCSGIAAGNTNKNLGRRYGVAKDALIYVGKVLSNTGSGTDSGILAGMEWAITNGCKVISMSLGAEVEPGEAYSNIYNDLAKKALSKGTLIIAAAGNESDRGKGVIAPVGHPANCPAIMSVAALDSNFKVAYFSCGGSQNGGGQIDIAAPGMDIYSSWKSPEIILQSLELAWQRLW
jgi:subtilisin